MNFNFLLLPFQNPDEKKREKLKCNLDNSNEVIHDLSLVFYVIVLLYSMAIFMLCLLFEVGVKSENSSHSSVYFTKLGRD